MKAPTALILITTVCVSCLAGADRMLPSIPNLPNPDTSLIASPVPRDALPTKIQARILRAEHDAAVARIAHIDAQIRQIKEESEVQVKELSNERERLLQRKREIMDSFKDVGKAPNKTPEPTR